MNIFIGYRRDDGGHARALYEKLLDWYDADQVFLDHESINPGEKFTDALENAIADCTVFFAVIGQHWLSEKNHQRLQEGNDITRGEIRSALKHGKTLIPVLAGGAGFPAKSKLPADIQAMGQANAHHQLDAQYQASFHKLLDKLDSCYSLKPVYRRRDGSPTPFRIIDLPLSPNFVDPAQRLPELRRMLDEQGVAAVVAAATIHGMGGVGKTQMALKYSNDFRAQYAGVWWFRAENTNLLEIDCKDFLIAQGIAAPEGEPPHQTLKRWMQTQPRWLLVYDNAENKHDLAGFLPTAGGHHLIVTSRDPDWSDVAQSLTLDVWTEEKALEFLRRRLKSADDQERCQLAHILGGLPLALEQACAYILKHRVSVAVYCREVESWQRENILLDRKDATGYPYSVLTTLSLAFVKLGEPTKQLLRLCAWFAAEPIPERIFREHADLLPEALQAVADDDLAWAETVAQLEGHALIQRAAITALDNGIDETREEPTLSLHRLTQVVVRARLVEVENDLGRALLLLWDALPGDVQHPRNWPACASLLPHVQALERFSSIAGFNEVVHLSLLGRAATYLQFGKDMYSEAQCLFELALEIAQTQFGEEDENTLSVMNNLALVLKARGDLDGARTLQENVLKLRRKVQGDEHTDTLVSMSTLASTLMAQGDLPSARVLDERVLELRSQEFGEDHPATLRGMNNFAETLRVQGDLDGAYTLHRKVLDLRRKVLGEEDRATLTSMNNLSLTLSAMDNLEGARELQEKTLEIRRRVLGEEHSETLTSKNNLAGTLRELGDMSGARTLQENVLKIRHRELGGFHSDTTISAFNLFATLLQTEGMEVREQEVFRDYLEWLLQRESADLSSADQRNIREQLLIFIRLTLSAS